MTKDRPYEENAHTVTVTGWACKHCGRFYGSNEHLARWCCCTDRPCECGGRMPRDHLRCNTCQRRQEAEKWDAKPEVAWDGEFPIAIWDVDEFFFDEDALLEFVYDHELTIESLRLTSCRVCKPPRFDMSEYLTDWLAEDQEVDCDEINETVNTWIAEHKPTTWVATGQRLSLASVKRLLGIEE